MKVFLLSFLLLISDSAFSQTTAQEYCENLGRQTCYPGRRSDPTGSSILPGAGDRSIREQVAETFIEQNKPELRNRFLSALRSDENRDFANLVIRGLELGMYCSTEPYTDLCLRQAAERLVNLYSYTQGILPEQPSPIGGTAETKTAIVENIVFEQTINDFVRSLRTELPQLREIEQRIRTTIFPRVRAAMLRRIDRLPIAENVRTQLKARIPTRIGVAPTCRDERNPINGMRLYDVFAPNHAFNRRTETIDICAAYLLSNSSEFALVAALAHEIGHSIDACEIALARVPNYIPDSFVQCLASVRSAQATSRTVPLPSRITPTGPTNNRTQEICLLDGSKEAFANWVSAEVTGDYISEHLSNLSLTDRRSGIAQIHRAGCTEALVPSTQRMLDSLFSVQPQIRNFMGCRANHPRYSYCQLNTPPAANASSTAAPREVRQ